MMKPLLTAAAALAITASVAITTTAATAGDFDNNAASIELYRDNVKFGVETVEGNATALTFDVAVLPHQVLGADADLTLGAEYGVVSQDLTVSAAYGVSQNFDAVTAYGEMKAAYTVATGSTNGVWIATPLAGASYAVNDKLSAFGEVSYDLNVSNDWKGQGGLVEVGGNYDITDGLYVRPSLTRSFDTAANETNVALKVGVSF